MCHSWVWQIDKRLSDQSIWIVVKCELLLAYGISIQAEQGIVEFSRMTQYAVRNICQK